jgi:hypothetical protein
VKIGSSKGIFNKNSIKYHNFYIAIPSKDKEIRVCALVHKTIADEYQPSSSDIDPNSLHQWEALVQKRRSVHESFEAEASDSVKVQVKARLQATLDFIIPTHQDGTWFFMWYQSN